MRSPMLVILTLSCLSGAVAQTTDSKVEQLNSTAFDVLSQLRRQNHGTMTQRDALQLREAILEDGQIDAAERDLLVELTTGQFRRIIVRGASGQPDLVAFPTAGLAQRVLKETLSPSLDMEKAWNDGQTGYDLLVAEYAGSSTDKSQKVVEFLASKLGLAWKESSKEDAYKPFRDLLAHCYGRSPKCPSGPPMANGLLYEATCLLDERENGSVPDFLYQWLRPKDYQARGHKSAHYPQPLP